MKIWRLLSALACFIFTASPVDAFFDPLTDEERVAASSVIAVIRVAHVHDEAPEFADVVVVQGLKGCAANENIKIWDEKFTSGDGGEYSISGRDAHLQEGETYLIYLARNKQGRLVTVQSSLDSLKVTDGKVEKQGGKGMETLEEKLARTRELIKKLDEPEAGQPADVKPPN
ncbi:hypothetical protein JIN84_19915 [Luteolibacter yonseiensis]|uniref:Uncharacterized protein n=1 Tax=Luteolibacter yonseiensis TaxID=1144680 RepID=A0A934VC32_9BACT|nr:hypothetical protein [Luteolibacter yonseiensis]MBK1817898.1 hypothetical protein [Luteolibacter yonseiensis]